MATDFTDREDLSGKPAPEDVPFAPTPVFARDSKAGRKARGRMFAARPAGPAEEPRSFDPTPAPASPAEARVFAAAPTAEDRVMFTDAPAVEESEFVLPEREIRPGRSVPIAALVAIPVAIVLAGGAYFLMQPREPDQQTVAMTTETAPAALSTAPPLAPPPEPVDAKPVAEPAPTARAEAPAAQPQRQARATRTRPAAPPAATDSGVEASATTPSNPLPYTAVSPEVTPAPGAVNPPVVAAEPANPAPTQPAPTPTPDTSVNPAPAPDSSAVTP